MEPRARVWVWMSLVSMAGVLLLAQCSDDGGETDAGESPPQVEDAGEDAGKDAGVDAGEDAGADGGSDAGDAGDAGFDGGTDAGFDAGPPLVLPIVPGWQFYGAGEGGPRRVFGVSSDEGGNVWVAGGDEGLFLLEPGAGALRRFTVADGLTPFTDASGIQQQRALSVAGAARGTVYLGYEGHWGNQDDLDPPYLLHSGGVDKVVLAPGGLKVTHLELASRPGTYPQYPAGRYKIRNVLRIVHDRSTGDAWFGGNHGVAMWNARGREVIEHQHPLLSGYLPSGIYTLLSGDYYGVGLDPSGDVWFGGGHRLARLGFASQGRQFWSDIDPVIDIWPDAVSADAHPWERTDDFVQDLAVASDGTVWVGSITNGLAHVMPSGTDFYTSGMVDKAVTALELDPKNGSLWVGHQWGGLTRFSGGGTRHFDASLFGEDLVGLDVPDIQSDNFGGRRRILVAFRAGAVGIYTGD
ncbi:MAG: hypothetical protein ACYC8T_34615 [Myxococcaceae bacterium]